MIMATAPTHPEPKKSRYPNCVICPKCHAEYDPSASFMKGVRDNRSTSTDNFTPIYKVSQGHCPMCEHQAAR